MPARGRKPKPQGQAVHRNKPTLEWTDVLNVPFKGGRKLPAKMPNGLPWPPRTRKWWQSVSSMPHCKLWSDSDWEFAEDTAYVAGIFHMQGSNVYATELRNRERVIGTTADYRRDLRIRYVDAPSADESTTSNVASMDDYRDL